MRCSPFPWPESRAKISLSLSASWDWVLGLKTVGPAVFAVCYCLCRYFGHMTGEKGGNWGTKTVLIGRHLSGSTLAQTRALKGLGALRPQDLLSLGSWQTPGSLPRCPGGGYPLFQAALATHPSSPHCPCKHFSTGCSAGIADESVARYKRAE